MITELPQRRSGQGPRSVDPEQIPQEGKPLADKSLAVRADIVEHAPTASSTALASHISIKNQSVATVQRSSGPDPALAGLCHLRSLDDRCRRGYKLMTQQTGCGNKNLAARTDD
jgi:hypothetical protein